MPGGSQVECSVDVEVGVLADTLGCDFLGILGVLYLPLLVQATVSSVNADFLALRILGLLDFEDLTSSIDELTALVSEDLPPSTCCTSELHCWSSTVVLDVEGVIVTPAHDCFGPPVEVKDLVLSAARSVVH